MPTSTRLLEQARERLSEAELDLKRAMLVAERIHDNDLHTRIRTALTQAYYAEDRINDLERAARQQQEAQSTRNV